MSKKPIIFNTEMVKAILDGRKTQTRRVIKNNKKAGIIGNGYFYYDKISYNASSSLTDFGKQKIIKLCSPYKAGDILYVREPVKIMGNHKQIGNIYERTCNFKYLADDKIIEDFNIPYRFSASHINHFLSFVKNIKPTWLTGNKGVPNGCIKEMARIFLKVTNVRVERLQDIGEDDVWKEGTREITDCEMSYKCDAYVGYDGYEKVIGSFKKLWNSTAKDGYKWEDNPYVLVYEFEKVEVC